MNNLINHDLLDNLTKLREESPEKFFFLKAFMTALVNNEPISVQMSLNSEIHTVTVIMGEYMYKEKFETLEAARKFIDMTKDIRKEVA